MAGIVLTIEKLSGASWDLELPGDLPAGVALSEALEILGVQSRDYSIAYDGRILTTGETLVSAGVRRGAVLLLTPPGESPVPRGKLVLANGREIALHASGKGTVTIGRPGPRGVPSIDLSLEVGGDSVSREQATLHARGRGWELVPTASLNPTLLNGEPLPPNEVRMLISGDAVQFAEVRATFRS